MAKKSAPTPTGMISFLMRHRVQVGWLVLVVFLSLAIARGVRPHAVFGDVWGLAGALLTLAGALLRSWAAGVIHKMDALATTGPYALARHPLYLGSFLLSLGLCLVLGDWLFLAALAALAGVIYIPKMRTEERKLADKFPQAWKGYTARTGMLFPRRWPQHLRGSWSYAQWRHNREYNAFFTSLLALAALELWRRFSV